MHPVPSCLLIGVGHSKLDPVWWLRKKQNHDGNIYIFKLMSLLTVFKQRVSLFREYLGKTSHFNKKIFKYMIEIFLPVYRKRMDPNYKKKRGNYCFFLMMQFGIIK